MTRNVSVFLAAVVLALACGSSEPERPSATAEQEAAAKQQARLLRSMATLEAVTDRVRKEVLRTCDKWKHIKHPCVDEDVRTDQLECWLDKGIPAMQVNLARRIGPYMRDRNALLQQDLCMEKRGWRKLKRGAEF